VSTEFLSVSSTVKKYPEANYLGEKNENI